MASKRLSSAPVILFMIVYSTSDERLLPALLVWWRLPCQSTMKAPLRETAHSVERKIHGIGYGRFFQVILDVAQLRVQESDKRCATHSDSKHNKEQRHT